MIKYILKEMRDRDDLSLFFCLKISRKQGEGVLMIIANGSIIVFHLIERIVLNIRSLGEDMWGKPENDTGFSYLAIPTRHEVP